MIILPDEKYKNEKNEKISTYQFLASVGCPVFDSVLFEENEDITKNKLIALRDYLKSEYCTIRYQYVRPTSNPIKGGNKSKIELDELKRKQVEGTQMWLLQPIDRTKNIYGINIYVNRESGIIRFESVGKGFDVSDLNRGEISPQESITFDYPIRYGMQNEWWKYIDLNLISQSEFDKDKIIRLNKLSKFGLVVDDSIFDKKYVPMDMVLIEKLMKYINLIDERWNQSNEYIVSISMNSNGKLVYWDIQTPMGKSKILRGAK